MAHIRRVCERATASIRQSIATYCAAADNIAALARANPKLRARSAKIGAAGQDDELRRRVEINGIVRAVVGTPKLKGLRVGLIIAAPLDGRKLRRRLAIGQGKVGIWIFRCCISVAYAICAVVAVAPDDGKGWAML